MTTPILLDSNIIIYTANPEYGFLFEKLKPYRLSASKISVIEMLGFHKLEPLDKTEYELFFNTIQLYDINNKIIQKSTELRQHKKMSLGDAIILATAIIHDVPLMTRNSKDFDWIDNLTIINPFDE